MDYPFSRNFDDFYISNYHRVFYTALRTTQNYHDSEELVDEAFVIYSQKSKETVIENPSGYVMGVLGNLLRNYLKSQRREKWSFLPLHMMNNLTADEDSLRRPLTDILPASLLPWEREILILRYEKNYSFEEISAELGLKEVSCRSRLCRAKTRCQKLMMEEEKI